MRWPGFLLQIAGLTMLLTGAWWVLQGLGIVGDPQSSFIAGKQQWGYIGAGVFALGGVALSLSRRFRR